MWDHWLSNLKFLNLDTRRGWNACLSRSKHLVVLPSKLLGMQASMLCEKITEWGNEYKLVLLERCCLAALIIFKMWENKEAAVGCCLLASMIWFEPIKIIRGGREWSILVFESRMNEQQNLNQFSYKLHKQMLHLLNSMFEVHHQHTPTVPLARLLHNPPTSPTWIDMLIVHAIRS